MALRLSRADEVLDPERTEAFRKKAKERAEARTEILKTITKRLLKDEDFKQFLDLTIEPFGFWRYPSRELSPYEQGYRAAIHKMVERIISNGGEDALKWFSQCSAKYASFLQKDERERQ